MIQVTTPSLTRDQSKWNIRCPLISVNVMKHDERYPIVFICLETVFKSGLREQNRKEKGEGVCVYVYGGCCVHDIEKSNIFPRL